MINTDIENTLNEYLKRILEVNQSINLTSITDYDQASLLHLEDSLLVLDDLKKAPEGLYGDIGSGAGFPGVPLGIASNRDTILIDSVKKKMKAVSEILTALDIKNIRTNDSRIEDLCKNYRDEFSVITARALSTLPILLELSAPLLNIGGQLIALKAHVDKEELEASIALESKLGMKLIESREYYLSDNETFRSVYIFEKYKEPEVKLPRKTGIAQKRPLKP